MEVSDYLNQPGLDKLIQEARFIRNSGKRFSDVEDENGLQYVDLVLEAQGISFMSLLGYTFILEEAGLNFFNIAGVSSGALNAMIVAALGHQQHKSVYILKALNKLSNKKGGKDTNTPKLTAILKSVSHLRNHLFPNQNNSNSLDKQGNRQWVSDIFQEIGITSLKELNEIVGKSPDGMKHIFGGSISDLSPRLAIITSDITTHTKVELPAMAELYWSEPEKVSPVEVILASMAIPYFHNPYTIDCIPNAGELLNDKWLKHASFGEPVPESVRFMDGSMIYNPPFNIFHRTDYTTPRMPTLGATVEIDQNEKDTLSGFTSSLISNSKKEVINNFLKENPDCKALMTRIKLPANCDWLNFDVSDEQKLMLFKKGVQAGLEFLSDFNWQSHKSLRNEGLDHRFCGPFINTKVAS